MHLRNTLRGMIATAALALTTTAGSALDLLGAPGPFLFQGKNYAIAWSSQSTPHYVKQDYAPSSQRSGPFDDIMVVEVLAGEAGPRESVALRVEGLEARRASDALVSYQVTERQGADEIIVDFIISDLSADPIIVEWNVYRYLPYAYGQGTVLFGVSRRARGEEAASEFLSAIETTRAETIKELTALPVPDARIKP